MKTCTSFLALPFFGPVRAPVPQARRGRGRRGPQVLHVLGGPHPSRRDVGPGHRHAGEPHVEETGSEKQVSHM